MTSLSNQLEAERNMKKRLKIEQEKEIRDFKAEKNGFETKIRDLLEKLRRVEEAKRDAVQTASAVAAVMQRLSKLTKLRLCTFVHPLARYLYPQ